MAENKKENRNPKTERPAKPPRKDNMSHPSGAAESTGGSRQGNAGHQANNREDNAHR